MQVVYGSWADGFLSHVFRIFSNPENYNLINRMLHLSGMKGP